MLGFPENTLAKLREIPISNIKCTRSLRGLTYENTWEKLSLPTLEMRKERSDSDVMGDERNRNTYQGIPDYIGKQKLEVTARSSGSQVAC